MRRYDEPVEVRRGVLAGVMSVPVPGSEPPEQFLWRRRVYTVREVLGHWLESEPWWHSAATDGLHGVDRGSGVDRDSGVDRGSGAARPDADRGAERPVAVLEGIERDVWRVEAVAGRLAGPTVVDLAYDWTDGQWLLVYAHD